MDPESALAAARRAAAARGADYGGVEPIQDGPPLGQIAAKLSEWAVLDPSDYPVGSIRRLGAPITALKRLLLRLLLQFHAQLLSDQSRYNVLLLAYVRELETRVAELERRLAGEDVDPAPDAAEDDWA